MKAEDLIAQVLAYKNKLYKDGRFNSREVSRMHLSYSCYLLNVLNLEYSKDTLTKDIVFKGGKLTPWIVSPELYSLSSYNTNYFIVPYCDDKGIIHYTKAPIYDVMSVPSYFTTVCDYIFNLTERELSELWERDPMYQKLPPFDKYYEAPYITYFDMKNSLAFFKNEVFQ